MKNFLGTIAQAFALAIVLCVPFTIHQVAMKKSASGMSPSAGSRFAQGSNQGSNQGGEPELAAAIGANAWKILPNIKKGRFESTAILFRDDIYTFNGFGLGIKVEATVEKFDAGTQTWSVIGDTSVAKGNGVTHNGFVVVGNEVWILGGRVGNHPGAVTADIWKFNLITHQWSQGPQLPVPVAAGGAALVDNRIHWFGGLDANASCDVDNHYVYDLNKPWEGWNDISGIAPMPIPRNHFATVVHDDLIYAIGGQFTHDGCGAGTPDSALVHVFNPKTNNWKQLASLPEVQSHNEPSSFSYKGAIYVVGGATNGNKVYRYDPSQDDWDTVAELPQPLLAPIAQVVDDELIVSSGGAPATVPSLATYSINMKHLLLPGAYNANDEEDLIQAIINDPEADLNGERGLVSLEAEYYDTVTSADNHQWVSMSDAGASENTAMITTPDTNTIANGAQGSPSISYFAYFDRPGTWYLWVRGSGDTVNGEGSNDSMHAGLNGKLSPTADKIDNFPPGWNWSSSTRDGDRASLKVPSAGIHAVNLWMREDGLAVDKILLTTDASYTPTGKGDEPSDNASDIDSDNLLVTDSNNDAPITSTVIIDEIITEVVPVDTVDDTSVDPTDDTTDAIETTVDDDTVDDDTADAVDDASNASADADSASDSVSGSASGDSGATSDATGSGNGIIALEVEYFDSTTTASNKKWVRSSQSGASGNASMVTPNTGLLKAGNQGSPAMNYKVNFDEAGTYTVWLRGWGDTVGKEGKNDSVHVGLNGKLGSAAAIQNFPSGWHWSSEKRAGGKATVNVPSSGLHTINIWMREDGLILDRLILTKNASFTPSGLGASVSTLAGGASSGNESPSADTDTSSVETVADTDTQANDATTDSSLISVEVESYASKSGDGAHQWIANNKSGSSSGAMEAAPNNGKLNGKATGSAVLNYPLQFSEAGTYKVWLRGLGDSNGASRDDSVYVTLNSNFNAAQVLENFPNNWAWSNKKRGGGSVTVKVPSAGTHVLNLAMREDGLILDKLILSKDASLVPVDLGAAVTAEITPAAVIETAPVANQNEVSNATRTQNFVAIRIEAEDYTSKNHRWVLTSPGNIPDFDDDPDGPHNGSASGRANLELLPDTRVTHDDPTSGGPDGNLWGAPGPGPSIDYLINFPEAGRYIVYVKTYSTNSEDNGIHVGINGTNPDSGKRMQTCAKNRWVWTSSQRTNEEHCGVRKQIWVDVPAAGLNEITFYAREDGFELDQILLLKETHNGTLDCYPNNGDDIRCENAASGARVGDTDIPLSTTVGSDDASAVESTVAPTDTTAAVLNNKIYVVSGSERKGGSPESTAHEILSF